MGFLLPREERELVKQVNRSPMIRRARRHLFIMFLVTFGVLFLMIALLSPQFTGWIWQTAAGEVSPAHDLLTGYLRWYWLLLTLTGGTLAVSIALLALYLPWGIRNWMKACGVWKNEIIPKLEEIDGWDMVSGEEKSYRRGRIIQTGTPYGSAALCYDVCALLCFLLLLGSGGMLRSEQVLSLPGQARADLAQVESGFLETAEVWISPKCRPSRLPGPYGGGQPALVTRYGIVGEDTGGQWVRVYVPNALDFSLDQKRLFDENETIGWNWEHARRYQVQYTSNFHLVTEVIPVA